MLLKKALEEGKIQIAENLIDNFVKSLSEIKFDKDDIVIPETVDGRIRSLTIMLLHEDNKEKLKNAISLIEIQRQYFELIEHFFGFLYKDMLKYKVDPRTFANNFIDNEGNIQKALKMAPQFLAVLNQFWKDLGEAAFYHIEDQQKLKASFGGELFPDSSRNIASTTGLYLDTIILPDPFLRTEGLLKMNPSMEFVFHMIRHALTLLSYKDLALANLSVPIIAILPDRNVVEKDYYDYLDYEVQKNCIMHASIITDKSFNTIDEVAELFSSLKTVEEVEKLIKNPQRLLFDTEWKEPIGVQISKYLDNDSIRGIREQTNFSVGSVVFSSIWQRMMQASDIQRRSHDIRGIPLIQAPTSWEYYNWKISYDSQIYGRDEEIAADLHITRAMQNLPEEDFAWLGNIPTNTLIKMRQDGAIDEFRSIIGSGINEIINLDKNDFLQTGEKVIDNLSNAFRDHQLKLMQIESKILKLYGLDLSSCLLLGGISIAASFLPNGTAIGASLTVGGMMFGPKTKNILEIIKEWKKTSTEKKKLSSNAVGILFKHKV